MCLSCRICDRVCVDDRCHRLCGCYKALLDPSVTDSARIGCRSHIYPRPCPTRTVTGEHIAVLVPSKVCKLVKAYKVILLTLILSAILHSLHCPKVYPCSRRKLPNVLGSVIYSRRKSLLIYGCRPTLKLCKLRKGLTQYQCLVVRYMHLPQSLRKQCIRLATACCSAV